MIQGIITKMKIMRDANTFLFLLLTLPLLGLGITWYVKLIHSACIVVFSLGSGKVHVYLKGLWSGYSQVWFCPPNILSVCHRKGSSPGTGTSKTFVPDRHLTALPLIFLFACPDKRTAHQMKTYPPL